MLREVKGKLIKEDRKFFTFTHVDGQLVGTKAVDREKARAHIERCLEIKLKEAA